MPPTYLNAVHAILLIDCTVSILLLALFKNHDNADDEDGVHTGSAKERGEDDVKIGVRGVTEGCNTAWFLRSDDGFRARLILGERRRVAVDIAAAVELDQVSLRL